MTGAKLYEYVQQRNGVYHVRMSVPQECRVKIGKRELKRSLETRDKLEASLRAAPVIASFRRQIAEAQAQCTGGAQTITELNFADAKEFVRKRLLRMQAGPDRSRSRSQHLRRGQMGNERATRLAENTALLAFYEEVQIDRTWDGWRTGLGRSAVQAYEAEHGVTIAPHSTAHDQLIELGTQAQIEHVRRAIYRDQHPYEIAAAPDNGSAFGDLDTGLSLDELLNAYKADKELTWKPASGDAFRKVERVLRDWFGKERPVGSLTRIEFKELFQIVARLPVSYSKMKAFRGLTLRQVVETADGMPQETARLSATSCKDYVIHVQSVLNWAVREDHLAKNPASGLSVLPRTTRTTLPRPKFQPSELQALFNCGRYALGTNAQGRDGSFWLPLVALFTGMRSGEVAQLRSVDVAAVDGVMCIRLTDAGLLKNEMSVRDVPVHPELRRLGFLDFVDDRRSRGLEGDLFPDLRLNAKGDRSSQYSKVFRKMLETAGLSGRGLSMHCFRHTMSSAFKANEVAQPIADAVLGWGKTGRTMYHHYGGRPPIRQLADAVECVTYHGLNLGHLYPCTRNEPTAASRRQFD